MYIETYDIKVGRHLASDLSGITQLEDWCIESDT